MPAFKTSQKSSMKMLQSTFKLLTYSMNASQDLCMKNVLAFSSLFLFLYFAITSHSFSHAHQLLYTHMKVRCFLLMATFLSQTCGNSALIKKVSINSQSLSNQGKAPPGAIPWQPCWNAVMLPSHTPRLCYLLICTHLLAINQNTPVLEGTWAFVCSCRVLWCRVLAQRDSVSAVCSENTIHKGRTSGALLGNHFSQAACPHQRPDPETGFLKENAPQIRWKWGSLSQHQSVQQRSRLAQRSWRESSGDEGPHHCHALSIMRKHAEEVPVAVARQLHQHHPGSLKRERSRLKETSLDACLRHSGVMLILAEVTLSHHLPLSVIRCFLTHDHLLTPLGRCCGCPISDSEREHRGLWVYLRQGFEDLRYGTMEVIM